MFYQSASLKISFIFINFTYTHTHTLKHPWHFLPFQIIILTKGKLFFFSVRLCGFDFWSYFTLDGDLLTFHWKHENSFCFDFRYVIRNPFLMTAACFPGLLSPSPFAPYLGKLITNICVLHHLTDGHFKQCKYQPRRYQPPGPTPSTIKTQSWAPLPLPCFTLVLPFSVLFCVLFYANSNLYFTTFGATVSFITLP